MLIELEKDNLQEIISQHEKVIVQYSAGWCGNCKIMKPKFKRFSEEDANATYIIVDAEQFPESRKLANVNNLPTFAKFNQGQLIQQIQTNKSEVLKEFIEL
jgi:thiol-disulfide isomerase/thioredoxin